MEQSRPGVLVVDDDEALRKVMVAILKREPRLEVRDARNGRDALEMAAAEPPALLILDMMLPDMSGVEVFESIREARPDQVPRVIAITGSPKSVTPDAILVAPYGDTVVTVMRKPIDQEKLLSVVKMAVGL